MQRYGASKILSREYQWNMIEFMLKEDYKYIIWVTHASPTHIHTIHVGIIDFVVVFVGHARAQSASFSWKNEKAF